VGGTTRLILKGISAIRGDGTLKAALLVVRGAGRAVAGRPANKAGVEVTLVNRGRERGVYASGLFRVAFYVLSEILRTQLQLIGKRNAFLAKTMTVCRLSGISLNRNTTVVDFWPMASLLLLSQQWLARGGTAIDGSMCC